MNAPGHFQIADDLLSAPLFQGMSRPDLQTLAVALRQGVQCHKERETVLRAGAPCAKVVILLRGTVRVTTCSASGGYELSEILPAPRQFQVERMFGRNMEYTLTVRTVTECVTLSLTKRDVLGLYNAFEVFRINLLNMLVMKLQRKENSIWTDARRPLGQRIVDFIARRCYYPAGEKSLKITMNSLAAELNDSRLNVSRELNRLEKEGLVVLSRGVVEIPAMEALYSSTIS